MPGISWFYLLWNHFYFPIHFPLIDATSPNCHLSVDRVMDLLILTGTPSKTGLSGNLPQQLWVNRFSVLFLDMRHQLSTSVLLIFVLPTSCWILGTYATSVRLNFPIFWKMEMLVFSWSLQLKNTTDLWVIMNSYDQRW